MSFRTLAVIVALVTLALGAGYLFAGSLMMARWQLETSATAALLCRRIGAVYLGLSVVFYFARSVPASDGRTGLCVGGAVMCVLLGVLGLYELGAGHAGRGILMSAALEILLAAAFVGRLLADRRARTARTSQAGA